MTNPQDLLVRLQESLPRIGEKEDVWCMVRGHDLRAVCEAIATQREAPADRAALAEEAHEATHEMSAAWASGIGRLTACERVHAAIDRLRNAEPAPAIPESAEGREARINEALTKVFAAAPAQPASEPRDNAAFLADKSPGSEWHLTMLMLPYHLNMVVGQDRQHLLSWGRDVWKAAQPAAAEVPAYETVPWPIVTQYSGGGSTEGTLGRVWLKVDDTDQEIEYAPAAALQAQPASQWVPVSERLPESGVPVLICVLNSAGKARRLRAHYAAPKTIAAGSEDNGADEYDEETDTYWLRSGWYETNEYEEVHWHVDDPVSHWTPLPAAPTQQEDSQ